MKENFERTLYRTGYAESHVKTLGTNCKCPYCNLLIKKNCENNHKKFWNISEEKYSLNEEGAYIVSRREELIVSEVYESFCLAFVGIFPTDIVNFNEYKSALAKGKKIYLQLCMFLIRKRIPLPIRRIIIKYVFT